MAATTAVAVQLETLG